MKGHEALGLLVIVGIGAWILKGKHEKKKRLIELHRRRALPEPEPTDVFSEGVYKGQYVNPIRPTFPHNAPFIKPHTDPYTGKLVSNHSPFPAQPRHKAEDFIVNKIVHEFTAEGRLGATKSAELKARLHRDYMMEIGWIARNNGYKHKPLHGEVLSKYSSLILELADNHGLYLSPSARARYQAQQYYVPHAHQNSVHRVTATNIDYE